MTRDLPTAIVYHEQTKYSEQELTRSARQLDWSTKPQPWRDLVTNRRIDLTPWLPFDRNPFTGDQLEAVPRDVDAPLGLAGISRLLYFTYGITAVRRYPGETHALRAAPSAGGLYPTEVYVATRGIDGVADGVHDYQARDHSLVTLWDGDFWAEFARYAHGHEAIAASHVLVILSGVFFRSSWRYEERAYRRILLDTGHVLGNLECYAPQEKLLVYPVSGFCDEALNSMLFLDPAEEGILMVCALTRPDDLAGVRVRTSSVYPSGVLQAPAGADRAGLIQRLHAASSIPPGEVFTSGQAPDDAPIEALHADRAAVPMKPRPIEMPVEQTILRRRSTRTFSGASMARSQLADLLGYAYDVAVLRAAAGDAPGQPVATSDGGLPRVFDPSLIETYVVVQAVDGLAPGIYYYAPRAQVLRLVKPGQFRARSHHLCLGQELGLNAAAVVIHVSDVLRALSRYGERAYRYLHLDAGHLGQRMNLAAVALGVGASGIGGFFDDEVNALLSIDRERIVVYLTCLGVPADD